MKKNINFFFRYINLSKLKKPTEGLLSAPQIGRTFPSSRQTLLTVLLSLSAKKTDFNS